MTVEENQRSFRENENNQKFPVGMRVLAVDDDPTCLKLLENLLRKCQYNVTTTGQAITALKLLRENREKFDLVISDVHMPDMDGFKLLELVGLEMDLPVIMLSANSDTRAVMKGITHGACDYLLKPVRIEELKNIWQHVIRRRKIDSKDYNHSGHGDDNETLRHGADESGHGTVTVGATDQKTNRKRKDQNEDDEDDYDENGHEHDDPSAQKKPRVVWSVELHQKFVAAVNQLGIDKAVPKRILDLMNVERLTRENVASHLQKYRLYLKRISCVANQQGNLAAALGGRDSFVPLASLDGFGDFHALPSFPLGAVGRLNSLTAMGMRSISPSGMPQLVHESNSGNSINYLGKFHRFALSGDQQGNLLHGLPTSLELDQLQQKQSVSYLGEFSGSVDESSMFPISQNRLTGANSLNGTGVSTSYSSCSFLGAPNSPLVPVTQQQQQQQQQAQGRGLGNQSPVTIAALEHEFFDVNAGISSHLPEYDRCNTTWQNAVPLAGYSAKPLAVGVPLNRGDLSSTSLTDNVMLKDTSIECNPFDISSNSLITEPSHDPLIGGVSNRQGASLVDANARRVAGVIDESSKFSMLGSLGNTRVGHSINYGHNQDYTHGSNTLMGSPINSMVVNHRITSPMSQNPEQNNGVCSGKMNVTSRGQLNSGLPIFMQQPGNEKSVMENQMKMREEYLLGNVKSQGGFSPNSCNSFNSLIDTTTKQEQDEETFMEGDIGCDVYPIGTCI